MPRRFLRDTKTGQYWGETGWVHDIAQAMDFPDMSSALSVFNLRQLQDAEFFMQFGDKPNPQFDIHFDLSRRQGMAGALEPPPISSRCTASRGPKRDRAGSKESGC